MTVPAPRKPSRIALASLAVLACFAWLPKAIRAAPDVTAAEARAFLGGRTGKVVYLKDYDSRLYYIDLSDSALRERPIASDSYCNSPMISPDGSRVLYESQGNIYIRPLAENTPTRYTVRTAPLRAGYFNEPRWWIDPASGAEYVIYTTGYLEEREWPQKSGQTYVQKIVNNLPSGPATMLLPFLMGGGRSRNGLWGATSNHTTGMFRFVGGKVDSAFYSNRNWLDSGYLLGCNPSISTSKDSDRQDRMMHLSSGEGAANGKLYENHKAIFIRSWKDESIDEPLWYIGPPGDNCNDDGSGNLFWNFPEWSNDENYFVLVGSKEIDIVTEADLYFSRISYTGPNRILRIMKGGSKFYLPCLWIQDGNQPARIRLEKSSLSFSALKRDTANPPSQTVPVSNAGDGILPELKIGPLAKWLRVEVAGNGTNASQLVVSVSRDSVAPGEYRDTVLVSFGSGVDSQAFTVAFRFSDPVPTTLAPLPAIAVVLPGDTLRLRALVYDQSGGPMIPQPAITWSALGDLDVSSNGLVRADTVPWRVGYAVAVSGNLVCTTTVRVARHYLKVDAGADQPTPGWGGDGDYAVGTSTATVKDSIIDLFGVENPAPVAVYQSFRFPAPAYRFALLPNGRYRVRLHFTSPDTGLKELRDPFSVRLQETRVLENYKLPSLGAQGGLRGDVKEASVSVTNGKGLAIDFLSAIPGHTAVSGVEVYDEGTAPIEVLSPNGGERINVGDTLAIRWNADTLITSCGIQISMDSGLTWHAVTRRKAVQKSDPEWGDYRWAIPDTLDNGTLVSDKAMISVYDYFGADRDRSDGGFSIGAKANSIRNAGLSRDADWFAGASESGRLWLRLPGAGNYRVSLSDFRGRTSRSALVAGGGLRGWDTGRLPAGIYRLRIDGPGLTAMRLIPVF